MLTVVFVFQLGNLVKPVATTTRQFQFQVQGRNADAKVSTSGKVCIHLLSQMKYH